ncbi:MAG: hypothetical protein DMF77_23590 [Acidobacteria bacterium]|nr:MAG: hypothetical protein DMF77_23590 [Acidobacteriota bacterium]
MIAAIASLLAAPPHTVCAADEALTADEVSRILAQAAAGAASVGLSANISVVDAEGRSLGLLRMDGAPSLTRFQPVEGANGLGLETVDTGVAAFAKAASGALLSSGGNAFSTRTASFIVQEHFPPGIDFTSGGPLFGVQFSSVRCSDVNPVSPLGLAADPGGFPLYKNGRLVGGVGVEGDGTYALDRRPDLVDVPREEQAARAGQRGFEPPEIIRADHILADGIRLAYTDTDAAAAGAARPGLILDGPRAGGQAPRTDVTLGGVAGQADPRYPTRAGQVLSAGDVNTILTQAAQQTGRTRAAIRQPLGSSARVSIAVVDLGGDVLGFFQNADAPRFGIDVSVQKGRTALFFSSADAAAALGRLGLGRYLRDGVPLDGSVAYTSRAVGFLAQPFFPPGIPDTSEGPFSQPIGTWSIFNTGLQLDLIKGGLLTSNCVPGEPRLRNGITIFPGGIPLYKGGRLAGAIGISGDGVDQDDLIAAAGTAGFEAPPERRSDQLVIRGVRLPYVKTPRHPEL